MPMTITLKNIPDELYDRLRQSAQIHRRSINSEAILCLETVLQPVVLGPSERLEKIARLRDQLDPTKFHLRDIDEFKRRGRP